MKVLNIIQSYVPAIGGSESWCRNFCLFLAKKGIVTNVTTINMYDVAEAFDVSFSRNKFIALGREDYEKGVFTKRYQLWKPWLSLPSAKVINFLLYKMKFSKLQIGDIFRISPHSFEMYRNLFKEIKKSDVVVLHTLPYFHNLVGYLIAKAYRKPIAIVPHFHPGHPHHEKKIFFKILDNCNAIITVSDYEKEQLINRKVNSHRIVVSGNCIDRDIPIQQDELKNFRTSLFTKYGINGKSKKIIFIGRKEIYKGIFILIEAAKKLAIEENKNLFLFLVGPDTPDFNRIYPELNNSRHLKIINFGVVSEKEKACLLQLSDLLVLPSQFEAFGIVFLEAWAYKKPVIGINRGAIPGIISGAGLCAEYGNADDLKTKMKRILSDEKLSEEMGKTGRDKLDKEYSIEKVYKNIFNVLTKYKKKVLVVSHLFPPHFIGGSELAAYEQSKLLEKMEFKIRIFAGKINDSIKRFHITREKGKLEITRVNLHHRDFLHFTYANFYKSELQEEFRKELYNYAPDIVHFHNIYALSLNMLGDCYDMNIPTVMTLHDYWGICPNNILLGKENLICARNDGKCLHCQNSLILENGGLISLEERNLRWLEYYNKLDLLISPSRYLAERYIDSGLPRTKFKIIKNGINLPQFKKNKKIRHKRIRFGFIGQIAWHKGLDNLLDAISLLSKTEKERVHLSIAGSGDEPYLSYCKSLAKELNSVRFLGKMNHRKINRFFNTIDILVVPSLWPENSPLVIQEALASGTPVIAPDIGGIPELVEDGISGFLYQYNNSGSLAGRIKEIINNPRKIDEMQPACLLRGKENGDLEEQVKLIADEYRKII